MEKLNQKTTLQESIEAGTRHLLLLLQGLKEELDKETDEDIKNYLIASIESLEEVIEHRKNIITAKWSRG